MRSSHAVSAPFKTITMNFNRFASLDLRNSQEVIADDDMEVTFKKKVYSAVSDAFLQWGIILGSDPRATDPGIRFITYPIQQYQIIHHRVISRARRLMSWKVHTYNTQVLVINEQPLSIVMVSYKVLGFRGVQASMAPNTMKFPLDLAPGAINFQSSEHCRILIVRLEDS